MRFLSVLVLLALLTACAPNLESELAQREEVRLFLAMEPDAVYAQSAFSADEFAQMSSLISEECPAIDGAFTRAAFTGSGASLIAYAQGENVSCVLFRPNDLTLTTLPLEQAPEGVALVVNGVQIPIRLIDAQLDRLPQDAPRDAQTLSAVLTLVINDELLRQELVKLDVPDKDRAQARAGLLAQLDASEETLEQLLAAQGISAEQFDALVDSQARLAVLARERLHMDEVQVSDELLQQVYLQDPNRFLEVERATMRHILISTEQRSAQEAQERALMVAQLINTTDFCELVREYSDDPQRKEECGVFIVPRGVVDPQLERASFATPAQQTAIVVTAAGVHLVQSLEVTPAQVVPFDQAASDLRSLLVNDALQQRLGMYVAILRGRASVTLYSG